MTTAPDLRAYLRTLDAETLAELLLDQAGRDPRLRHELELRAVAHGTVGPVLDTLQRLLDAGTRADLTPLARRMADGGATGAELRRAIGLYARACAVHRPDPRELAGWILETQFDRPGWPAINLADFAAALGEEGLEHLRAALDTKPPTETTRRLTEQLAEVTGDVDTLLASLTAQPPTPATTLRIVRLLRSAGRHGEAIAHAARTVVHPREGVLALRRAEFRRNPSADTYHALRAAAEELDRWPAERDDALARLAECDPAEAIPDYRRHVEELIQLRDPDAYREAAQRLRELRTLHRRADRVPEFGAYLADLVDTHRRKTRLLVEVRNARIAVPRVVSGRKAATMGA